MSSYDKRLLFLTINSRLLVDWTVNSITLVLFLVLKGLIPFVGQVFCHDMNPFSLRMKMFVISFTYKVIITEQCLQESRVSPLYVL